MGYIFFIYVCATIFLAFTLGRIYYNNQENNNLLFSIISTYLSNLALPIFLFYYENLILSAIISILLALSSFYLYLEIEKATGNFKLLALPYVVITFFAVGAICTTLIIT